MGSLFSFRFEDSTLFEGKVSWKVAYHMLLRALGLILEAEVIMVTFSALRPQLLLNVKLDY